MKGAPMRIGDMSALAAWKPNLLVIAALALLVGAGVVHKWNKWHPAKPQVIVAQPKEHSKPSKKPAVKKHRAKKPMQRTEPTWHRAEPRWRRSCDANGWCWEYWS